MPMRGHWHLECAAGARVLNPGDTCLLPPGMDRSLKPAMTGEASLYRVRSTLDPAGASMARDTKSAA